MDHFRDSQVHNKSLWLCCTQLDFQAETFDFDQKHFFLVQLFKKHIERPLVFIFGLFKHVRDGTLHDPPDASLSQSFRQPYINNANRTTSTSTSTPSNNAPTCTNPLNIGPTPYLFPLNSSMDYLGCYTDSTIPHTLPGPFLPFPHERHAPVPSDYPSYRMHLPDNTPQNCLEECQENLGSKFSGQHWYFGLESGGDCWCSNMLNENATTADGECGFGCMGDGCVQCGAKERIAVYKVLVGSFWDE